MPSLTVIKEVFPFFKNVHMSSLESCFIFLYCKTVILEFWALKKSHTILFNHVMIVENLKLKLIDYTHFLEYL